MKNSNRLMLLGGVVGLMLTAISPLSADMGGAGMNHWQKADANQDGSIDRAEFDAQHATHFKAIDGTGDGFATADEMKAFHDQRRSDRTAKFLKRFDSSGDGQITSAEWPSDGHQKFSEVDSNGDGTVTAEELGNMRKHGKSDGDFKSRLERLDTDKDGKVSAAEWTAGGDKMFARLDDDQDGKITKEELPKHRKRDKIQDGTAPVQP